MAKKNPIDQLPKKFEPGYLANMDKRTELFRKMRENFQAIATDLGGEGELSHVKATLVERFVFMQALLAHIEAEIATNPEAYEAQLGKYTQTLNALTGLAKTIGIDRQMVRPGTWDAISKGK